MTDRDHSPTLEPRQLRGEDVWYVEIVWSDGHSEQVGAFRTKAATEDWITKRSAAWLEDYERRTRKGHL